MNNPHRDLLNPSTNFLNEIPEPMLEDDSFVVPVNCSINNFVPIYNTNADRINWNSSFDLTRISITVRVINDYIDYSKVFMFVPMLSNFEICQLIKDLIQTDEELQINVIKLNNSEIISEDESHIDYSNGDTLVIFINNIININLRERSSLTNNDNVLENLDNNLNSLVDYLNVLIDVSENGFGLDNETHNETLTTEDVDNITQKSFKDIDIEVSDYSDTCIVCQECYSPEDTVSILKCGHFFHKKCLDNWLLNYNCVCPFCRTTVNS